MNKIVVFCNMEIHIGNAIKAVVDQKGWSVVKFAKAANMSYRTALYLFERTDTSIQQLIHVGKVLDYDFVQLFVSDSNNMSTAQENVDKIENVKKDFITMNMSLIIGGSQSNYDRFPELMRKTRQIAMQLGFELM